MNLPEHPRYPGAAVHCSTFRWTSHDGAVDLIPVAVESEPGRFLAAVYDAAAGEWCWIAPAYAYSEAGAAGDTRDDAISAAVWDADSRASDVFDAREEVRESEECGIRARYSIADARRHFREAREATDSEARADLFRLARWRREDFHHHVADASDRDAWRRGYDATPV